MVQVVPAGRADQRLGMRGRVMAALEERFWAKVEKTEECWLWDGCLNSRGYGCIGINGVSRLAHRVAYEAAKGPIPDGLVIDHLCHNADPSCSGGPTCRHRRCWPVIGVVVSNDFADAFGMAFWLCQFLQLPRSQPLT